MAWYLLKYGNLDVISHNGATGGFRSYSERSVGKSNSAVIVLVNNILGAR